MKQDKDIKNKFMQRPKEKGYEFVIRIMKGGTYKEERLSAKQVQRRVDQRGSGKMNMSQVQSHLRYAAEKTGLIIKHKDKIVCPIRKRRVDTYSYNHTEIPNAFTNHINVKVGKEYEHNFTKHDKKEPTDFGAWNFEPTIIVDTDTFKESRDALVSTVKHEFTAKQLLNSIEALNKDVYETIVACLGIALGQEKYDSVDWTFTNDGNLVVKE